MSTTATLGVNLGALPAPQVIEQLDYERILSDHRRDLSARAPELQAALELESEPMAKLIESHAYRELLFRERVNSAARAQLLAFATGADLDHKAAFYGTTRLQGESDERLRERLVLRIASLAGNGTREAYEYTAMSTSLAVRSALAVRTRPGYVQVLVWPQADTPNTAALLQAVNDQLQSPTGHALGVIVTVAPAQARLVDVTAQIWRNPTSPVDLIERARQHLTQVLPDYARLGRSVPRSWITAQLHAVGASAVRYPQDNTPAETTTLGPTEYPVLGRVVLSDMGAMA